MGYYKSIFFDGDVCRLVSPVAPPAQSLAFESMAGLCLFQGLLRAKKLKGFRSLLAYSFGRNTFGLN